MSTLEQTLIGLIGRIDIPHMIMYNQSLDNNFFIHNCSIAPVVLIYSVCEH